MKTASLECPQCHAQFQLKYAIPPKRVRCPKCRMLVKFLGTKHEPAAKKLIKPT